MAAERLNCCDMRMAGSKEHWQCALMEAQGEVGQARNQLCHSRTDCNHPHSLCIMRQPIDLLLISGLKSGVIWTTLNINN